ncbi:MAG: nucleotidyltransferase family protein [Paludibacteraceae bacterium]|nr:nucleotidyltransferase family protein [Paludibacteraceae bacterium]
MKAMIFAAGLGTRLKPLTNDRPKALVELNGKTLLQWQIEKLKNAGITDIIVNVHHFANLIIDYLRENNNFGCNITISDERDLLLDTGGGLKRVESLEFRVESSSKAESLELIGEPILALNVDILSNIDIRALVAAYEQDGISRLVVSDRKTSRYLLFDKKQQLIGWTNVTTGEVRPQTMSAERPADAAVPERLAFSGMQILSPRVCARLINRSEEVFSLIDFYLDICQKEILQAYVPEDYKMFDVGKFEHLSEAQAFAASL